MSRRITYDGGYRSPYGLGALLVIMSAFGATITINAVGAFRENEAMEPIEVAFWTLPAGPTMAAVSLIVGLVGAAAWFGFARAHAQDDKQRMGAALLLVIVCAAFSALNTYTMRLSTSVSATELSETQSSNENLRQTKLKAAADRVKRAGEAVETMRAASVSAQREFDREVASGFGSRSQERKAELDTALAKLAAARADLVEAEEAQDALLNSDSAVAEQATSGAMVIASQTTAEKWMRIMFWVVALEALGLLPTVLRRKEDLPPEEEEREYQRTYAAVAAYMSAHHQPQPAEEQPLFAPPQPSAPPPQPEPVYADPPPMFEEPPDENRIPGPPRTDAEKDEAEKHYLARIAAGRRRAEATERVVVTRPDQSSEIVHHGDVRTLQIDFDADDEEGRPQHMNGSPANA